jgi:DNA replication and repair protein RecF
MRLSTLRLVSFRAHADSQFTFAPKVNLLYGANGAGKTNVVEAVHYLCLSKSFLASTDQHVLRRGSPFFEVEGRFESEHSADRLVRLVFVPGQGKKAFVNRAPLDRLADLVGVAPVVALSPADHALTADGPDERRRFIDNTLSQARPTYLADLFRYKRALKQRNALLLQARRSRQDPAALEAWDEELVTLGSRLVTRRARFLAEFARYLAEAYQRLDGVGDEPTLTYDTVVEVGEEIGQDQIAERFRERLHRVARRERELGRTAVGPHRDEVVFKLGGFEVRPYASQGQHRLFGVALQLARFFYLHEQTEKLPLLLLDDVFGTLDAKRAAIVLELLRSDAVGQSLVTAARRDPFDGTIAFDSPQHTAIEIADGQVVPEREDGSAPPPVATSAEAGP